MNKEKNQLIGYIMQLKGEKMNREKKLIKNTLIITIGTICTKMITFFLLPLYTGVLTTEEYGTVDLLNTLIFLMIPLITLQTEHAVFSQLIEVRNNKNKISQIISSSLFSIIIQCIIFLLIYLFINPFIKSDYNFLLLLNIYANIFSSFFLQISRGLGDNKRYAIGSFLSATSTILFNLLFLLCFNMKVKGMLLGMMLGQVVCYIYLFIYHSNVLILK